MTNCPKCGQNYCNCFILSKTVTPHYEKLPKHIIETSEKNMLLKEVCNWAFQQIITKDQLYEKLKGLMIFGSVGEWQIEQVLRNNSRIRDGHEIVVPEEMFSKVTKELKELDK